MVLCLSLPRTRFRIANPGVLLRDRQTRDKRTDNRYVSQLEARVAALEIELAKYNPSSEHALDHSSSQRAMSAAVHSLAQQYPLGPYATAIKAERAQADAVGQGSSGGANVAAPTNTASSSRTNAAANANAKEAKQERLENDEHDELAMGVGMLSLSGMGDPLYLGASSGVNWARVCAT